MNQLILPLVDIWQLFFPRTCLICEVNTPQVNKEICFTCELDLPYTDHHLVDLNEFKIKFIGRVELQFAEALFYFSKEGIVQKLIHQFKYNGQKKLCFYLGNIIGKRIASKPEAIWPDAIIPVPIHYRRKSIRGYNQAQLIAEGIAETLNLPVLSTHIKKHVDTKSQTNKSRTDRFSNVLNSFKVSNKFCLKGKHLLIVDDVSTTGATLEACAKKLLTEENIRLSFSIIALARS